MTAPDPFALGGRPEQLSDEIIVDEEVKALLVLMAREPVLGPLAHRLFEANELCGNTVGGSPVYEERAQVCHELDAAIADTPAQTIGGIVWRLLDLRRTLDFSYDLDPWTVKALHRIYEDALRLARAELGR